MGNYNLRAMGISSYIEPMKPVSEHEPRKLMFYDFDGHLTPSEYAKIKALFPADLICYNTKHGVQFISFLLLNSNTQELAKKMSQKLGQDYIHNEHELTLRISAKWDKWRRNISPKPIFFSVFKPPKVELKDYLTFYSIAHLDFYHKYMGLPTRVYDLYQGCNFRYGKFKIYHYQTRD